MGSRVQGNGCKLRADVSRGVRLEAQGPTCRFCGWGFICKRFLRVCGFWIERASQEFRGPQGPVHVGFALQGLRIGLESCDLWVQD